MNFLLKKLFRKYIEPSRETKFLVKVAAGSGYEIFLDQKICQLMNFENQTQSEKDRIFNELVVTALVLLLSIVESRLPDIEPSRQEFWQTVHKEIPDIFTQWLTELEVHRNHVDIWRKLIDLRYDEYKENRWRVKQALVDELEKNRDEEEINEMAVRVATLTTSGLLHITRGRAKPDHPLRKSLRTWLLVLGQKLEKRVGW